MIEAILSSVDWFSQLWSLYGLSSYIYEYWLRQDEEDKESQGE